MHTRPSRLYITSRRDPNRPIAVHLFSPRTRLSPHLRFFGSFPRSRASALVVVLLLLLVSVRVLARGVRVVFAVSVRVRVVERVVSADSVLQLIQALQHESRLSQPILEIPFPVFEAEPEVLELEIRVEVCVRGSLTNLDDEIGVVLEHARARVEFLRERRDVFHPLRARRLFFSDAAAAAASSSLLFAPACVARGGVPGLGAPDAAGDLATAATISAGGGFPDSSAARTAESAARNADISSDHSPSASMSRRPRDSHSAVFSDNAARSRAVSASAADARVIASRA